MVEIRVVSPVPEADVPTLFAAESLPGDYADITWSFGDGGTGTGTRPSHEYAEPGEYTVEVDVFQGSGFSQSLAAEDRITVDVIPLGGQAPADDPVDEPPESGIDPTPGTSRDKFLGIAPATAAEGNGIGSDTPGIQPREKAKAQVRRESDGETLDFFFQAPAEPGIYERRVDFGDVDTTATYEVEPFPDDTDTGGGGTAPDPEPGPGPLLSIPKPTLESVTIPVAGQTITVPSFLTFGSETFDVRLPSFDAYLQTANLGFDLSSVGFRLDQLTDTVDDLVFDVETLGETVAELQDTEIVQGIQDRIDGLQSELAGSVQDLRQEIDQAFRDARGLFREVDSRLTRLVNGLESDVRELRQTARREIDQALQTATDQIDQAIEGLRLDLLPEALDPRALSETIRREVRAVLPVTLPEIGQAVADTQELVNDEALSSFLSDPAGYVLNAVLSEARRRASPDLAGRLGRIIDRLLEEAIDPEVKQRLNEATTDNDA
jgi:PKD repeat protein